MQSGKGEGSKSKKDGPTEEIAVIVPPSYFRRKDLSPDKSYDWKDYFALPDLIAAKASSFKHTPLVELWRNIEYGVAKSRTFVEILHTDVGSLTISAKKIYWIGEVLKVAGYRALIRPLGTTDKTGDYWVNVCSSEVYPVATLADRNMTLLPPQSLEQRDNEYWKGYIMEILSKNLSIPGGLQSKMKAEMMSRFAVGLRVEVVDKKRISHVRPATVDQVVGRRLKLIYDGDLSEDFWCSDQSQWLHPVGWAKSVNHALIANVRYHERCEKKIRMDNDAPKYLFESYAAHPYQDQFDEGMKLEAVDPLNLKEICAATIYQVLQHGYVVLRIDSYEDDKPANRFCVHVTNPLIFYVGFCEENGVALNPPHGHSGEGFSWISYLKQTGTRPVTKEMIKREEVSHTFTPGMKLEAVDLMNPHLICVATVYQVIGRLLRIRFDGWDEDYDHWVDCRSPDIYPIGWCDLVGFQLTGPPLPAEEEAEKPVRHSTRLSETPPPVKRKQRRRSKISAPLSPLRKQSRATKAKAVTPGPDFSRNHCPVNTVGIPKPKKAKTSDKTSESPSKVEEEELPLSVRIAEKGLDRREVPKPEIILSPESEVPKARKSFPVSKKKRNDELLKIEQNSEEKLKSVDLLRTDIANGETSRTLVVENPVGTGNSDRRDFYIFEVRKEDIADSSKEPLVKEEFVIPKILGSTAPISTYRYVTPHKWGVRDVIAFLDVNGITGCGQSVESQAIDGALLLRLTLDQIKCLTGNKLGPTLKLSGILQTLVKIGEFEKAREK